MMSSARWRPSRRCEWRCPRGHRRAGARLRWLCACLARHPATRARAATARAPLAAVRRAVATWMNGVSQSSSRWTLPRCRWTTTDPLMLPQGELPLRRRRRARCSSCAHTARVPPQRLRRGAGCHMRRGRGGAGRAGHGCGAAARDVPVVAGEVATTERHQAPPRRRRPGGGRVRRVAGWIEEQQGADQRKREGTALLLLLLLNLLLLRWVSAYPSSSHARRVAIRSASVSSAASILAIRIFRTTAS